MSVYVCCGSWPRPRPPFASARPLGEAERERGAWPRPSPACRGCIVTPTHVVAGRPTHAALLPAPSPTHAAAGNPTRTPQLPAATATQVSRARPRPPPSPPAGLPRHTPAGGGSGFALLPQVGWRGWPRRGRWPSFAQVKL